MHPSRVAASPAGMIVTPEKFDAASTAVSGREELHEALKAAIGSGAPQVVEVPVTPGMALF